MAPSAFDAGCAQSEGGNVEMDVHDDRNLLALQGPKAAEVRSCDAARLVVGAGAVLEGGWRACTLASTFHLALAGSACSRRQADC